MNPLTPYIRFAGNNCRQAMSFYQQCLGGELEITKVGESAMADQFPPEAHDGVLHAVLTRDGEMLVMGSDMSESIPANETVALCLHTKTFAEIEGYFNKLAEGGTVTHALAQMPFGSYGDLNDKFGISWMFQSEEG